MKFTELSGRAGFILPGPAAERLHERFTPDPIFLPLPRPREAVYNGVKIPEKED